MPNHPRVLLVEGKDDEHVLYALRDRYQVEPNFAVIDCKGVENLMAQLPVRFKESNVTCIGVIVDADLDLNARWNAIKNIAADAGIELPQLPEQEGTIVDGPPRFGVWLMPDNHLPGLLENFMQFLLPADDQLMPRAKAVLDEIEADGLNKYSIIHRAKADIHTWLSWQEEPGTPLGLSITKRYLDIHDARAQTFANWVKQLFN